MTNMQIKFLECIYNGNKNAEELCKLLKIPRNKNDELGGYYNALNNAINYLTTDDGNEIDIMFRIEHDMSTPVADRDTYIITKEGRKYIEDHQNNKKNIKQGNIIGIIGIIVAILAIVVSIILFCL